jgi:glycosyltransferase involved in cell wall biosynthesis
VPYLGDSLEPDGETWFKTGAMADLISVIVTTYNRPDALEAVLRGLARQTDSGFEVVIADDGSGPETAQLIKDHAGTSGLAITHAWQPDQGFRAAECRNRAILRSRGAYCIFLDGDCIPRRDFIARHRELAEPGWFVTGNRILLSLSLSERILRDSIDADRWGIAPLLRERLAGSVNRLAPALHLPLGPLRRLNDSDWEGARSCNLAVWRHDLDCVDGFDAAFSGWGLEDSDIIVRLIHAGVRRKDGRFATGVLHLWHPESDRGALPDNRQRLDAVIGSDRIRALQGLSALAPGENCEAVRLAPS